MNVWSASFPPSGGEGCGGHGIRTRKVRSDLETSALRMNRTSGPETHRPSDRQAVGLSQPRFSAWRTISTRLRKPSFSIERVLKVSTVFTLSSSCVAISLLA